jgi:CubicO group peptidase (beta-lactamase class C family)
MGLVMLCSFFATTGGAQVLPEAMIQKIDQVFAIKSTDPTPGFTVGIVRNDSLIFAKGYGMANLEYGIPNTPESVYHMASVSKQFTAYAILLLEKSGRLQLNDDIRKYLSWFPDLKQTITITHLMNHTSGIRDQWDLNFISGRRTDDVITQDYLINLLSRQQGLNFKPGAEFSYSNSNYTLMAEIVKSITGQSFRRFADSAIFKPLGMTVTHVHDDHTEMVPARAYSYRPLDMRRYANSVLNFANAGATSLFTNIPDMSKWIMNFYNPKIGGNDVLQKLTTKGVLNNGNRIPYAAGIIVDEYNGKKRFYHNGADAGYRTFVSVFPEERMGFMVFSNLATVNIGAKAAELTNLFMPALADGGKKKVDSSLAKWADTVAIARYMGPYISDDGVQYSYALKGEQVYLTSAAGSQLLARGQRDTLFMISNPDARFLFSGNPATGAVVDYYGLEGHKRLKRYTPATKDTVQMGKELKDYVGTYHSPEVDFAYTLVLENNGLQLMSHQSFTAKSTLEYITKDHFRIGNLFLRFPRNARGEISRFELSTGRTKHMVFNKVQAKTGK